MDGLTEQEFDRIVSGIHDDRLTITRHNPIGTDEETLLWMLMSCLVSYLSLDESETPCFSRRPDAETYREAVRFILRTRRAAEFDPEPYLDRLTGNDS